MPPPCPALALPSTGKIGQVQSYLFAARQQLVGETPFGAKLEIMITVSLAGPNPARQGELMGHSPQAWARDHSEHRL
jgi:hypothetical protein